MNDKPKPPTIVTAVCSTVTGLLSLAGCLCMMKSGGPDFLVLISIVANVGLPLQRMSSPQRPPKSNLDPVTADRPRSDALPFSTPTRPEPIRLIKETRDV